MRQRNIVKKKYRKKEKEKEERERVINRRNEARNREKGATKELYDCHCRLVNTERGGERRKK